MAGMPDSPPTTWWFEAIRAVATALIVMLIAWASGQWYGGRQATQKKIEGLQTAVDSQQRKNESQEVSITGLANTLSQQAELRTDISQLSVQLREISKYPTDWHRAEIDRIYREIEKIKDRLNHVDHILYQFRKNGPSYRLFEPKPPQAE